ncbi:MAG TPA: hypothetical protein VFH38_04915, partial [Jatrophihabitans sp.]|nr:hypothetical protein [Jatrophihabitans sp.]
MTRPTLRIIAVAIAAVCSIGVVSTATAAPIGAPPAPRNAKTLCRPNEHKPVHLSGGKWYQLRNPYWKGTGRACIHSLGGTRFK